MKYGRLAVNPNINSSIYNCFNFHCISTEDEAKFVHKFQGKSNEQNRLHAFRELILGAYLCVNKFRVQYEKPVEDKTPDWSILNNQDEATGIIELTNFHADKLTEDSIKEQLNKKGNGAVWVKQNDDRLYQILWKKITEYKSLVERHSFPYVVVVFTESLPNVNLQQFETCLFGNEGLFSLYPILSGVIHFTTGYQFQYIKNDNALHPLKLLSGNLSLQNPDGPKFYQLDK